MHHGGMPSKWTATDKPCLENLDNNKSRQQCSQISKSK